MIDTLVWALAGAVAGSPISSALGPLSSNLSGAGRISLREACADARAQTDWHVFARLKDFLGIDPQPRARTGDDWTRLVLPILTVIIIVGLYARFAVTVSNIMFLTSAFSLIITVLVFTVLFLRKAFGARQLGWSLFGTFFYSLVGAYGSFLIIEPPLHNVRSIAAADIANNGLIPGVMPHLGPLALQLVGALCIYFLLISSMALCVATVSAALITVCAIGSSWLWKFTFWLGKWATDRWFFIWQIAFAAIGLLCIYGLGYDILGKIPNFMSAFVEAILAGSTTS